MKSAYGLIMVVIFLLVAALRVGFEARYSDDEDRRYDYQVFIKNEWSFQMLFYNPAWRYFKLWPLDRLGPELSGRVMHFCDVVYRTIEPDVCYARMELFYGKPLGRHEAY